MSTECVCVVWRGRDGKVRGREGEETEKEGERRGVTGGGEEQNEGEQLQTYTPLINMGK